MDILVIYRHYWPDVTAYARLLKSIAERLAKDGHQVTVFTAQPSYNDVTGQRRPWRENVGGVDVLRMPLAWERKRIVSSRLLNSALFMGGALVLGALKKKPELTMTVSTPPALMGFTALLLTKLAGGRYLYHCQDLNPEVAHLGGKFGMGVVYRTLMWFEKLVHRNAAAVVVLSADMVDAVRERGLPGDNMRVLNNFTLELYEQEIEVPSGLQRPSGDLFRVLFAGNHGVFQGLEDVIEAANILRGNRQIIFQFIGDGLVKDSLVDQAGDLVGRTVFFHPYVSVEVVQRVMEQCDLGLVTLAPRIYKFAYPSKTMTLLTAGLPLLAVVERESELAEFIAREGIGWSCPPGDSRALAAAIQRAFEERKQSNGRRSRCREVAESEFGLDVNLDRWSQLIADLENSR